MLTTREVRRCSLGKEGAPRNTCLHWFALALERPGSFQTVITTVSNKPEVNQTKPEQAAEGSKICADSAGYAPQALVPLYDVN